MDANKDENRAVEMTALDNSGNQSVDSDDRIRAGTQASSVGSASHFVYDFFTERFSKSSSTQVVSKEEFYPWVNVILIAGVIGVVEYIPTAVLAWSIPTKYDFLGWLMNEKGVVVMGFTNIAISVGLVALAVLVTSTVPSAAGSGIPTLIAYLYNGKLKDNDMFSVKGVIVKMTGVVLSLSAGLIMGREGPAIHIGAAIGDLTNRLIDYCVRLYTGVKLPFDGQIKCNMVMMGSAAGFASAFRSPVGGMLFAIEELATHWDIKSHMNVGAQTFFAVAVAVFTIDGLVLASSASGSITFSSIIIFDANASALNSGSVFNYEDIPGFFVTAVLCGVFCGYTTHLSVWFTKLRSGNEFWRNNLWARVLDGVAVAIITASILSFMPLVWTHCLHEPTGDDTRRRLVGGSGGLKNVQYTCDDGDYSQLASLSLTGEEAAIRHLLSRDSVNFDVPTLIIFLLCYTPLSVIVMGLPVPCGTFVPNLLLGSLIGRIIGEIVETVTHNTVPAETIYNISRPGVYALIGAASQLGAWTRTLIAIVVTLVEITGDVGVVVPLIWCVVISRGIASYIAHHSFTHTIFYDLVDEPNSDQPPILHPTDWEPPVRKGGNKRRYRRTGSIDHGAAGSNIEFEMGSENEKLDFELGKTALRERADSLVPGTRERLNSKTNVGNRVRLNSNANVSRQRADSATPAGYYTLEQAEAGLLSGDAPPESGGRGPEQTDRTQSNASDVPLQHMQYRSTHDEQQRQQKQQRADEVQRQLQRKQSGDHGSGTDL